MAGRRHQPPNSARLREFPPSREPLHRLDDRHLQTRIPITVAGTSRSTILEDQIAIQHREIQNLLLDNQGLAAAHVALKQELALGDQDIRRLSAAAAEVKAERDAEVRQVYEQSLKLEAEVRVIDKMRAELVQVRGDVQKLSEDRRELSEELEKIDEDIAKARKEASQVSVVKAEIENLRREIQKGRAAMECEKKTSASNNEHEQTMEKNMIALSREIERLRAELSNAEKRALATAAAVVPNPNPGFAGSYANPEVAYGGNLYRDPYATHQGGIAAASAFVSGAMPSGPCDVQQVQTKMSMQAP